MSPHKTAITYRPIAAPLMPALGAVFAVLMALTLASEAGYLHSAQDIVSTEAEAASRLASAATTPGIRTAVIQTALLACVRLFAPASGMATPLPPATTLSLPTASAAWNTLYAAKLPTRHSGRRRAPSC